MARMVSRKSNGFMLHRRTHRVRTGDNRGMDIQLNGETRQIAEPATLAALLEDEGLAQRRVAVEVNGEIVPRGRHATHVLQPGDTVEIVHALGGG
ncbi:hypothetical protein GCM10010080_11260 [Thermomonas carbonis]|nr:hypothetical protein GCM10010080_11260 [Thermomonas carbonis]